MIKFGTDGIRGEAFIAPIDTHTALCLGSVLPGRVIVGRDSRISGEKLANAVCEGAGQAIDLGIVPTPSVSVALAEGWGDFGVVVTASHNPPKDNGLKVLASSGRKLTDSEQAQIEADLNLAIKTQPPRKSGRVIKKSVLKLHLNEIFKRLPQGEWLDGVSVVADAAHGAGGETLALALTRLKANIHPMALEPNGELINVNCGVMYPELLQNYVLKNKAKVGVALDGDADRCLLVSAAGRILTGDDILFLLARPPYAVGTVMTNMSLEKALLKRGITLTRTSVGDRFVDAAVKELGAFAGTEPSGHTCLLNGLPTACGILTALSVLAGGLDLDERLEEYRPFPSQAAAVRMLKRIPLEQFDGLEKVITEIEDSGMRTVLRYSGTEPVLRIFVEGGDPQLVTEALNRLVTLIKGAF